MRGFLSVCALFNSYAHLYSELFFFLNSVFRVVNSLASACCPHGPICLYEYLGVIYGENGLFMPEL